MLYQNLLIILIAGIALWVVYKRLRHSERAYYELHQKCLLLFNQNQVLRTRLDELNAYKNDVSKTFQILDNELMMINEHIKKQVTPSSPEPSERVSLLTPELLNSFFTGTLQNDYDPLPEDPVESHPTPQSVETDSRDTQSLQTEPPQVDEQIQEPQQPREELEPTVKEQLKSIKGSKTTIQLDGLNSLDKLKSTNEYNQFLIGGGEALF